MDTLQSTPGPSGEIRRIEDLVRIDSDLRHCWFRGHSTAVGVLLPSIQRSPYVGVRENIEFWAGQRFRLRAPSYSRRLPRWDDYISWLLLMQHHGVPTRLLDWTENALVALYFSVSGSADSDGEFWCMNHGELNWRSADWRACFSDTPPVRYLAAAAFLTKKELPKYSERVGWTRQLNGPLALIPPFQFRRMAAQVSRFTIHLSTEAEAQIPFLLRGTSLVRYIVPAKSKPDLLRQLSRMGFSHDTLFQTLDSLGRTIKEEILEPDFAMKDPPRLGSESE